MVYTFTVQARIYDSNSDLGTSDALSLVLPWRVILKRLLVQKGSVLIVIFSLVLRLFHHHHLHIF